MAGSREYSRCDGGRERADLDLLEMRRRAELRQERWKDCSAPVGSVDGTAHWNLQPMNAKALN